MFLTDADIGLSLSQIFKVADYAALLTKAPYWSQIVTQSHASAYQDVYQGLINRGFSASQIAGWDRGAEFENDQSLYWCLVKGGGLQDYDPKYVKMLDRREEIGNMQQLIVGGVWQKPGLPEPGQAETGPISVANSVFPLPCARPFGYWPRWG